ncbi:MAG: MoaD family protein [Planctomycetes bacterium]|nr:MoaD family protein [Planctomycetota bacterium]
MAIKVRVPSPLQKMTGNQAEVEGTGATLGELLANLDKTYPGVRTRVCDDGGKLRRYLNVYVNSQDVRLLAQEATALKDGDEVAIIPAIAGGAGKRAPRGLS